MIFSMSFYITSLIFKEVVEWIMGFLNHGYQQNPQKVQGIKKALDFSDEDVQKSLRYSKDRFWFGLVQSASSIVAFLCFLWLGGLGYLESFAEGVVSASDSSSTANILLEGVVFFISWMLITQIASLGFSVYRTFVIEEKYGFNRTTASVFLFDALKGIVLGAVILSMLCSAGTYLIASTENWWLWLWLVFSALGIVGVWLAPAIVLPLFFKLKSMDSDSELYRRIKNLAEKTQFKLGGIFTMNFSKRSTHGNAFFTGAFNTKKIVIFDNLIKQLSDAQIVAVMAHELGHFKFHHVRWSMITGTIINGLLFGLLYLILEELTPYESYHLSGPKPYLALFLLFLWKDLISFVLTPFKSYFSRKHEFQADAFAVDLVSGSTDLAGALVKMHQSSHMVPVYHPLYSQFYLSHPPLDERIRAMKKVTV